MGKGKKAQKEDNSSELLKTLNDFTSKENWDEFFRIRGCDDVFEWYAEWTQLRDPLLAHLSNPDAQILIPGCGSSRLSEHLYDSGYKFITNIDFSKVIISDMLRRNVRDRPGMRWRVMDMTAMQFIDGRFDFVVDKGGLDALMEPELGPKLGSQYLSEVRRVLKSDGQFIFLTLAESHVLDMVFSKLRFRWKTSIYVIPQKSSDKPNLQTFMVVAGRQSLAETTPITTSFDHSFLFSNGAQARGLSQALESENRIRTENSDGSDVLYNLEDLRLGVKGDVMELSEGRRIQLTLGDYVTSQFQYRAVLLDAQEKSGPFQFHCGVFLVPKTRTCDWLFSSEEGQWTIVESSKAARLILVFLDTCHAKSSMADIQKDLSPLVRQLEPRHHDTGAQIPFMMAGTGIKERKLLKQITSELTGSIVVEDVEYDDSGSDASHFMQSKPTFRRLIFERAERLVQSEALLKEVESQTKVSVMGKKKNKSSSRSKKTGTSNGSTNSVEVYHGFLAGSYHFGFIAGFMLISSHLEIMASTSKAVEVVVIGLGAGLLPMFLHQCMPFLSIEVVELDSLILDLARSYFGFREDSHLKVHIADGIEFVRDMVKHGTEDSLSGIHEEKGDATLSQEENVAEKKLDILIIDVDSSDSSSGLTCPAADFVEDSFLIAAKDSLSDHGLFIVNLVSRSQTVRERIIARMKAVFGHLFSLKLEEDVNEVLFAVRNEGCVNEDQFPEATLRLEKLFKLEQPGILEACTKIKHL